MTESEKKFRFAISLSVLNHLGRNLYRNFITVLGEAISNSWDADAQNVWIDIDRESGNFSIKDDGIGMSADDFQGKFLKIGYSKRGERSKSEERNRPYIGAKGIGKLALLSCARRVSIISKIKGGEYVGGVIDNSGLDEAIQDDLTPDEYPLEDLNWELFANLSNQHDKGTIVYFEDAKEQIKNSIPHIRKMLALSFTFSLIDENFTIHVNGDPVGLGDVQDLLDSTEFVWIMNAHADIFTDALKKLKSDPINMTTALAISGFIASVEKPRNLKITGTEERASIDLFVNGRLREKNILRHIPSQRVVESYLYGQLHFNDMDAGNGDDPFTSSREGVVEDNPEFQELLKYLKGEALVQIFDQWDKLRLDRGKEGDEENTRKSKKQRKARDLYSAAREEYEPDDDAENKDEVDTWLNDLRSDAEFNLSAYADCFVSENLVRRYIDTYKIDLDKGAPSRITQWQKAEADGCGKANISFDIRRDQSGLSYLDMDLLALSAEGKKPSGKEQSLWTDAVSYKPVRNVVGHTGLLTKNAKQHLSLTFENIKARVKSLVSKKP